MVTAYFSDLFLLSPLSLCQITAVLFLLCNYLKQSDIEILVFHTVLVNDFKECVIFYLLLEKVCFPIKDLEHQG